MRSRRRAALVTAAAIALGAAGCGGDAGPGTATPITAAGDAVTSAPRATAGSEPQAARSPAEVPEELRFTAAGVDGDQVVGADFAGKDVALWFWAPW